MLVGEKFRAAAIGIASSNSEQYPQTVHEKLGSQQHFLIMLPTVNIDTAKIVC